MNLSAHLRIGVALVGAALLISCASGPSSGPAGATGSTGAAGSTGATGPTGATPTGVSTDTPSTIVARDGSGDFATDTLALDGNLDFSASASTSSSGMIEMNGAPVFDYSSTDGNFFAGTGVLPPLVTSPYPDGNGNLGLGPNALAVDTTGNANVALGLSALQANTTGSSNIAVGPDALAANQTGGSNIALGLGTLYRNTSGEENIAIGGDALISNVSGIGSTAVGYLALEFATPGANTALGWGAQAQDTTGTDNSAVGSFALGTNQVGSYNAAVGDYALASDALGGGSLPTGSNNIGLGYMAGYNVTSGSNNIEIGNEGTTADANVTRIGTSQTATYVAGIFGTTTGTNDAIPVVVDSNGQLGTVSSSGRFKEDVRDIGRDSHELMSLRPVSFRYKPEYDPSGTKRYGLIAEEVENVDPNLVVHDRDGQLLTVKYDQVNAMLLNEVQQQQQEIQELHAEMEALAGRLKKIETHN